MRRYKLTLSYVQLYMETVLDLLEPEKEQLAINEDPTTGEVNCAGARVVEVTNIDGLLDVLEVRLVGAPGVYTCVAEVKGVESVCLVHTRVVCSAPLWLDERHLGLVTHLTPPRTRPAGCAEARHGRAVGFHQLSQGSSTLSH